MQGFVGRIAYVDRIGGVDGMPVEDAAMFMQAGDGTPARKPAELVSLQPRILGGMQVIQQRPQRLGQARQHGVSGAGVHVSMPLQARHQLHHALQRQHDEQQRQDGGAGSVQQR